MGESGQRDMTARIESDGGLGAVREAGTRCLRFLGLSLAVGSLSFSAQAQVLFQPADGSLSSERTLQLQADPLVVPDRWRMVRLDRDEIARAAESNAPLVFNLFDDVEVRGHVQGTKSLSGGSSFVSGSLEDGGHFTIFLHGSGIIRGEIHSPQGLYSLRSEGEDFSQVLVKQEDMSELPGCGNEQFSTSDGIAVRTGERARAHLLRPPGYAGAAGDWQSSARAAGQRDEETPKTIDALVVYTQRVEDHEGGPEHIRAAIENEMAEMNWILDNSGLPHRQMRLAMEKVDYEQKEHLGFDRGNLHYTEEDEERFFVEHDFGALDEVQNSLMEKHQADLVHLIVRDVREVCGLGGGGYSGSSEYFVHEICENADDKALCVDIERRRLWGRNVFSVSALPCLSGYTMAHELGHTMGLAHNREIYGPGEIPDDWYERNREFQPLNYGYGYIDPNGRGNCLGQPTVMSYWFPECDGGVRVGNTVLKAGVTLPYFSNPAISFPPPPGRFSYPWQPDTPMGVPGDELTGDLDGPVNASRTIDEVWDMAARVSDVPPLCNEGDIPADALSSLPDEVAFPAPGADREFAVSFAAPDSCADFHLQTHSSLPAFSASAEWLRQGEYSLSVTADPHNGTCGSGPRIGEITVSLSASPYSSTARVALEVSPATIFVEQSFGPNEFCGSLSGATEEAVSLDLSGQNVNPAFKLSDGMFSEFPRLEDLDLSDNLLGHFQNSYFDGLSLLTRLDLSGNELTELEDGVLVKLPELEHLDLRGNKLRRIKRSYFEKPSDPDATGYPLKTLDLSHNELRELDERWSGHLWHLESLHLNNNQLEAIDKDSLGYFEELKRLNLAHNSIEAVGPYVFAGYAPKLTHLNLSSNRISSIPDTTFGYVAWDGRVWAAADLRQLNLSRNRLEEFPELSMNGKLTHLWLGWNRIASVGDGLSELAELTGLQLSSNRLAEFPDLSNNGKLTRLWLGGNAIAAVGDGLSHLTELTALQLSRNQLEEMPDLSNNRKLTHLWLEGNKVASIPPRAFGGLSKLQYLNISDNPLTEPLPAAVCTFIRGVKTVVAEGIDMSVVCPD